MNPHFFTAPFYFAFIWFKVQGSRGGFAALFLEDGILVSQPSPLGEGAQRADRALAVCKPLFEIVSRVHASVRETPARG